MFCNVSFFHSPVWSLRSSATFKSVLFSGIGPIGQPFASEYNQESCQAFTFFPSPIAHPSCSLVRSLYMRIPLHPWEQADGALT